MKVKLKKLKKLTLNKEVVSNLSGNEMNQLKGGDVIQSILMTASGELACTVCNWGSGSGNGSNTVYANCNGNTNSTCGCTCGTAYTCNG
jgi:hypothetical protein